MPATHGPLVPFSYRKFKFPYSPSRALVLVSRLDPLPRGTVKAEAPPVAMALEGLGATRKLRRGGWRGLDVTFQSAGSVFLQVPELFRV